MALGNCGNYEAFIVFLASFFRSQNSGNLKSGLLSLTKLKPKKIMLVTFLTL